MRTLVKVGGDHGADAVARVELEQQPPVHARVQKVRALDACAPQVEGCQSAQVERGTTRGGQRLARSSVERNDDLFALRARLAPPQ